MVRVLKSLSIGRKIAHSSWQGRDVGTLIPWHPYTSFIYSLYGSRFAKLLRSMISNFSESSSSIIQNVLHGPRPQLLLRPELQRGGSGLRLLCSAPTWTLPLIYRRAIHCHVFLAVAAAARVSRCQTVVAACPLDCTFWRLKLFYEFHFRFLRIFVAFHKLLAVVNHATWRAI